ncbi:MAG: PLDc N-terminal domain-containing protein [Luteibaculaceae bacterium]
MNDTLIILLFVLASLLWVWAIFDLYQTRGIQKRSNLVWIILLFVLPIIAPLMYFQYKNRKVGR